MASACQLQATDFPRAQGHARLEYRRGTIILHAPVLRCELCFFLKGFVALVLIVEALQLFGHVFLAFV